ASLGGGGARKARPTARTKAGRGRAGASRASASIAAQSPASTRGPGATQEPPTHATFGSARYSGAAWRLMPPVGQKTTSGNGAPSARSSPTPPASRAGNSLSAAKPPSRVAISSDGVMTPGRYGYETPRAAAASSGENPGLTPKRRPACAASSNSSRRVIVPTPTIASGTAPPIASI